ncbi:MAG: hypothetical protein RDU20_18570 [Desulfomonilaceae bacterium]|nr:hypothetical protein [Desulfomonilaceae bacterium]
MGTNFRQPSLTAKQAVASLPLDPPPFFLEREIRLTFRGLGVYSTGVGIAVLLVLRAAFPGIYDPLPSLVSLLAISACSVGFYHGVRVFSYWLTWGWVIRRYPSIGGIHPAARGELPRNAFLTVLLSPSIGFVPLWVGLYWLYEGFRPEIWLCTAIWAASSMGDLRSVRHLVSVDPSRWIKDTPTGMDVLRLIGSD